MPPRLRIGIAAAFVASLFSSASMAASLHYNRPSHGDVYVRKSAVPGWMLHGPLKDPGGSDRYFSDTRRPLYILGPAFLANSGGYENLPEARDPFNAP